jgi:hypothetical protein
VGSSWSHGGEQSRGLSELRLRRTSCFCCSERKGHISPSQGKARNRRPSLARRSVCVAVLPSPHGLGRQGASLGPRHGGRPEQRRERRAGPQAGRPDELEGGGGRGREGSAAASAVVVIRAIEAGAVRAGGAGVLGGGVRRRPVQVRGLPPAAQGVRGALQDARRRRRRSAAALLPTVQPVRALIGPCIILGFLLFFSFLFLVNYLQALELLCRGAFVAACHFFKSFWKHPL